VPAFLLLVVGELLVPIIAERAPGGPTTWHPHHIAERYGLFTIIMLGEAVAAATIAIRTGLDLGEHVPALVSVAVDHYSHPEHLPAVVAGYAHAVPVAFYLFFVWLLHIRPHRRRPLVIAYLVGPP
jgi:hypothetical protein